MNVSYLCRFNVSPVDEYSSTCEKVQLSTRVQFSLLVSTLVLLYLVIYFIPEIYEMIRKTWLDIPTIPLAFFGKE